MTTPDIFLSYNREDSDTARRFAEGLEREGFSVWWTRLCTRARLMMR